MSTTSCAAAAALERLATAVGAIGQDAEIGDPAAEAAEQPEQDRAVGIVGARPARERRTGLAQLVAGREQRDPQRAENLERAAAEARGDADVLRPQPLARLQHHLARAGCPRRPGAGWRRA